MIYGIIKWGFNNKLRIFIRKNAAAHNHIDKYYNLWYNKKRNINIGAAAA